MTSQESKNHLTQLLKGKLVGLVETLLEFVTENWKKKYINNLSTCTVFIGVSKDQVSIMTKLQITGF